MPRDAFSVRLPAALLLTAWVCLAGCKPADDRSSPGRTGGASGGSGGNGGAAAAGGSGGSASGGSSGGGGGSGGASSGGGSGGASAGVGGSTSGSGGSPATGTGGSGGTTVDAPGPALDSRPASDGAGTDLFAEGDHLANRPDLRICKKEWTAEQCCAFLCSCLSSICSDSPKGKPGIATCMSWCPKLGDMARRCHVYHCFVSISPTGGIKDHDSHCGHAADQVPGGGCPAEVYAK